MVSSHILLATPCLVWGEEEQGGCVGLTGKANGQNWQRAVLAKSPQATSPLEGEQAAMVSTSHTLQATRVTATRVLSAHHLARRDSMGASARVSAAPAFLSRTATLRLRTSSGLPVFRCRMPYWEVQHEFDDCRPPFVLHTIKHTVQSVQEQAVAC